ncbi:MAG: hypothetical protein Q8K79_02160 [Solirubrobacteraceae bacterium]|nr:hypothetical protein [Solirubrobacteraceae bacterium]
MSSQPRLRKFALTAHVVSSVGWLGAVVVFLALSVVGLTAQDPAVVRAAYVAMESIGWLVLVPLSVASLLSGLVQSLGTKWGLFVHYWVVMKLAITVVATIVLLLYMQTLEHLAGVAAQSPVAAGDLDGLRSASPLLHSGVALLLLLVAATLSVFKPSGMTRYGQRKQHARRATSSPPSNAPAPADSV